MYVHPLNKDVSEADIGTFYQCHIQKMVGWVVLRAGKNADVSKIPRSNPEYIKCPRYTIYLTTLTGNKGRSHG